MAVVATDLNYFDGDTLCKGVYFSPENAQGPLPVVLVCHAWDGLIREVRDKATKLAESGYIAFAIDVYGEGKTFSDMATQLNDALGPFMSDRAMLLARMEAALEAGEGRSDGDAEDIDVAG